MQSIETQSIDMVSIQLVSPTSGDEGNNQQQNVGDTCFHSIGFPNEWGPGLPISWAIDSVLVSIQLVSPTSGDNATYYYVK